MSGLSQRPLIVMPSDPRQAVDLTDDALLHLAGWLFAGLALFVFATPAVVAAGVAYGLATWRRWRWWPLAAAGAAGLLVAFAVLGPAGAVHRHLLAVRDISDSHELLTVLIKRRWAAWLTAELPLAAPLGILVASLALNDDRRPRRAGTGQDVGSRCPLPGQGRLVDR